jgi:hypothetical protein
MTNLDPIRRRLGRHGFTPAALIPQSSGGWIEETAIRPAHLVEGSRLQAIFVGGREAWPDPVAFLDGIQRSEVVGYVGSSPLVVAEISAAVRERRQRRLGTIVEDHRRIALARPSILGAVSRALPELEPCALPDDEPAHPIRDLLNAARAVDQARGSLEIEVADRYRSRSEGWLIIDGALSESPRWAADPRAVGIARSHSILPFEGEELDQYLRLPLNHRSSIYAPVTRSLAPVRSWGLRLWPWEGKDLLHGLIRVEVAPGNGIPETANTISRWILMDRTPLSAPDRRWDRLLYGMYSVEQYLKART